MIIVNLVDNEQFIEVRMTVLEAKSLLNDIVDAVDIAVPMAPEMEVDKLDILRSELETALERVGCST